MSDCVTRIRSVRRISRFLAVLVAAFAVVVGTVAPIETASASGATASVARAIGPAQTGIAKTSLAGFNPGNIISDQVFTDKNTMTEAQIQSFFNSKVSRCVDGRDESGKPFVCLKDYHSSSVNMSADQYCSGYQGAPNESAARIIYKVAQSCNINPQVLIVMLQKEQALVTHVWPSAWRYDMALGQGCPDTAPCDPNYVGFFHQIYGAARQMQIYMEGRWFNWYAPGNTWGILYHPNESCGRGNVYVENKATAALYYYTPYQPNAAAMRAGYGEGDGCSSYGNRNFYNYFTDWFGPTQLPTPELQPINSSQHMVSVNAEGALLAYPFAQGRWGVPQQIGAGFAGTKVFGAGDLNGDGNRDLVAVKADGKLLFVSGTGSGYASVWGMKASFAGSVLQAAAGDFDGDGIPDMFTTNPDGTLLLWRGTDRGELRQGVQIGVGWDVMNLIVGAADMNGDGNSDLIARDTSGRLWLYPGNGRGGFAARIAMGSGWGSMTAITAPGDFDGDGTVDVLARDSEGNLLLYRNSGDGTVTNGPPVGEGWASMTTISGPGLGAGKPRALLPGAGDVNTDGAADVVGMSADGRLAVYQGNGAGGWGSASYVRSDWGAQKKMITLGDFTGDGVSDMGSVDSQGRFFLWAGDGKGGYAAPKQIGSGWDPSALYIGGMDFDGDRIPDVLVRSVRGDLLMYRGNGSGGWVTGSAQWIGNGWNIIDQAFYAGDFDGDGRGDLLARRSDDGSLWLYSTNGSGSWTTPKQVGTGWEIMTALLSPGDFDGDGTMDVLARRGDGALLLYRGNGKGGWGQVGVIGSGWNSFTQLG